MAVFNYRQPQQDPPGTKFIALVLGTALSSYISRLNFHPYRYEYHRGIVFTPIHNLLTSQGHESYVGQVYFTLFEQRR